MIEDHAEHRVSSCPVHFIWDGVGKGRMLVRWGFFGLVLAFALLTLSSWLHVVPLRSASTAVFGVAGASYLTGQLLSGLLKLRWRASAS